MTSECSMNVSVLCSIILLYLTTVVERSKTVAWCHCAWLSTTKGSWERCRNSWLVFSLWERNQCPPNTHISWYEWKCRVVSFYTTFVPLYAIYGLSKSSLLHSDTNLFTFFIFFQIVRGLRDTPWWHARLNWYHVLFEEFIRACWKWLKKPWEANSREGCCFCALWLGGTQFSL